MEFSQTFTPIENRTWTDRRYWAAVNWLGDPPPAGTPVQVHHWGGHPRVLSADGTLLGTVRAELNPACTGLMRAQVAEDINRIDISDLGPADFSAT